MSGSGKDKKNGSNGDRGNASSKRKDRYTSPRSLHAATSRNRGPNPDRLHELNQELEHAEAKLEAAIEQSKRMSEMLEETKRNLPHWLGAPASELTYEELTMRAAALLNLKAQVAQQIEEGMRRMGATPPSVNSSNAGEAPPASNISKGDAAADDAACPSKPWV